MTLGKARTIRTFPRAVREDDSLSRQDNLARDRLS